jgi:hypothetical protein
MHSQRHLYILMLTLAYVDLSFVWLGVRITKRFADECEKYAGNSNGYFYIHATNKPHLYYCTAGTMHVQSVYNFIFILRYCNVYYDLTLERLFTHSSSQASVFISKRSLNMYLYCHFIRTLFYPEGY